MSSFRFNRANQPVQIVWKVSKMGWLGRLSLSCSFNYMQLPMIFCFHVFFYICTEKKNDILLPPKETKYGDKGFVKEWFLAMIKL